MILTRQQMADILTDLQRDARRQAPATIRLRRHLAEVADLMEAHRLAEVIVRLKHPSLNPVGSLTEGTTRHVKHPDRERRDRRGHAAPRVLEV